MACSAAQMTTDELCLRACSISTSKGLQNGISATVMAYGQTGSGKTYTLNGDAANGVPGLITLLAERAMKSIRDINDVRDVRFHLSCVEAYDQDIIDLLRGANATDRKQASGRTWTAVSNVADLHEHVGKANRRRKTPLPAAT